MACSEHEWNMTEEVRIGPSQMFCWTRDRMVGTRDWFCEKRGLGSKLLM